MQEKIGNLDSGGAAVAALDIPSYNWWSESSTGVANEIHRSSTQTTKFAFPITTGMSFNRTLWLLTGRQIGREARAMMNAGNAYSTFWAPVINLAREPRWVRTWVVIHVRGWRLIDVYIRAVYEVLAVWWQRKSGST